jgi:hypothetical protein
VRPTFALFLLFFIVTLVTSVASADQVLSTVQWNIVFGETAPNVTTLQMSFDGVPVNYHPLYTDIGEGNQVVIAGSEFPWHPASAGPGLHFDFTSSPTQDFDLNFQMGGLAPGPHDSNDCTTNLSDVCGGQFNQLVSDPTYTYVVFNLNDYKHESVSLPNNINVRTTIGATMFFYGDQVPNVPEPFSGSLLAIGACGFLAFRRR